MIILKRTNTPTKPGNYVRGKWHKSEPPIIDRWATEVYEYNMGSLVYRTSNGAVYGVGHGDFYWSDELGPIQFEESQAMKDGLPVEPLLVEPAKESPPRLRQGWFERHGLLHRVFDLEADPPRYFIHPELDRYKNWYSTPDVADKGIKVHWYDEPAEGVRTVKGYLEDWVKWDDNFIAMTVCVPCEKFDKNMPLGGEPEVTITYAAPKPEIEKLPRRFRWKGVYGVHWADAHIDFDDPNHFVECGTELNWLTEHADEIEWID